MNLNCRFSSCHWSGAENEIFDHIESQHRKFVREPKKDLHNLYFDLSFDDLQEEALVLCTPGLYWFLQKARSDGIDYGIFHIGETEQVKYEVKLGRRRDHCRIYCGPYTSKPDNTHNPDQDEEYNLKFDFDFLAALIGDIPSRLMRLYFGEYDDSDDEVWPGPQDVEWLEEDERLNRVIVEIFTCPICSEYIRRDAKFCERRHYVCLTCFDEMNQRDALKCPLCRGRYLRECSDDDIERMLGMVKWPDMPEIKEDPELLEKLKLLGEVKIVKLKPGERI